MDDRTKYRIDFTITRRCPGEADFTEIGSGSSGAWPEVDFAAHMIDCAVQHAEWETEPGQPEPETVLADIRAERDRV